MGIKSKRHYSLVSIFSRSIFTQSNPIQPAIVNADSTISSEYNQAKKKTTKKQEIKMTPNLNRCIDSTKESFEFGR